MAWLANVLISGEDEFLLSKTGILPNVEIRVDASSQREALNATRFVMNAIAKGKRTLIRVDPSADTYRDFDTKVEIHRGYARFSLTDEAGKWENSKYKITSPSFGEI